MTGRGKSKVQSRARHNPLAIWRDWVRLIGESRVDSRSAFARFRRDKAAEAQIKKYVFWLALVGISRIWREAAAKWRVVGQSKGQSPMSKVGEIYPARFGTIWHDRQFDHPPSWDFGTTKEETEAEPEARGQTTEA